MSAFLGPIHVKMYDRVLFQDELSQALLDFAEGKGWTEGLSELVDARAPRASKEPLETLIDPGNIHGWLSQAVAASEGRFALIVSGILARHPERLGELQTVMKELGRKHPLPPQADAEQAFQIIHDILLDGMPCDFPFSVTQSGADAVVWQVATCPHEPYWAAEKRDAEGYYLLRDAWVEGALEGTGIAHTRTGGNHALRKER